MKKYYYSLALASALFATSCADSDVPQIETPDSEKEMISFSLSDDANQTRAGFTGADTKIVMRIQSQERGGLGEKFTRTCALAKKDNTGDANSFSSVVFSIDGTDYKRYWDDAHGRKSLLSVYAIAVPNKNSNDVLPTATLEEGDDTADWGTNATNTLTWDVSNAQTTTNIANRDLTFSNNIKEGGTNGIYRWDFASGNWKYSDNGGTNHHNGRMLFYQNGMDMNNPLTTSVSDAAGHFDRGHMTFNHALSRITVTLQEGTGFNNTSSTDFQFATSTNIKLLGMPISGTFDVATGAWAPSPTTGTINTIAPQDNYTSAAGTFKGQMLPGYKFNKDGATNVMEFTIDNNTYYITQKMIFDALTYDKDGDGIYDEADGDGALVAAKNQDGITMEMGKNYQFTIKVNKKEIEAITATLVEWSDVKAADTSIKNGHINISTSTANGTKCRSLYLYRNAQDMGDIITNGSYTATKYRADYLTDGNKGIVPTETANNSNIWNTPWFFENNRTAYHIRSINSVAYGTGGNNVENPGTGDKNTYFNMQNGTQAEKDYHWGAPMKTNATNKYQYNTSTGFQSHLHQGIMAINEGQSINITELHMMSNINVVLKTSNGSNAVSLRTGDDSESYKYATVKLTRLYRNAQVDMGIGLVTPTGDVTPNEPMTNPKDNSAYSHKYFKQDNGADVVTETNPFTWAVVPQPLWRGTSDEQKTEEYYVGITITTPDHNQYYVIKDLYSIKPTNVGTSQNETTTNAITRWYPNHKYTYTFTITKKGIEAITCTLVDWTDVQAGNQDINLEN